MDVVKVDEFKYLGSTIYRLECGSEVKKNKKKQCRWGGIGEKCQELFVIKRYLQDLQEKFTRICETSYVVWLRSICIDKKSGGECGRVEDAALSYMDRLRLSI